MAGEITSEKCYAVAAHPPFPIFCTISYVILVLLLSFASYNDIKFQNSTKLAIAGRDRQKPSQCGMKFDSVYTHAHNYKHGNTHDLIMFRILQMPPITNSSCNFHPPCKSYCCRSTWSSQDACALNRHWEPVLATSWSLARNLHED